MTQCVIIGSGFSGIFSALALVEKGHEVVMLDVGKKLDQSTVEKISSLAGKPVNSWQEEDTSFLKGKIKLSSSGIEKKLFFGSDYVYEDLNKSHGFDIEDAKVTLSMAKGGLSNVWGCSILPFAKREISDWPVDYSNLEASYKKVMAYVGGACPKDDLENILPSYTEQGQAFFPLSTQSQSLFDILKKNQNKLEKSGIFFSKARLATNPQTIKGTECKTCSLCLYGCCFDYLFSTQHILNQLKKMPNFKYISSVEIKKYIESDDCITAVGLNLETSEEVSYSADKLLLGTGAMSSAKIIYNSEVEDEVQRKMIHSDHFQLPIFSFKGTRDISEMKAYTLSQISLLVDKPELSEKMVHMQVYGYNDLYAKVFDNKFSGILSLLKPLKKIILPRLFVIKGYLHSDVSGHMVLKKSGKSLAITGVRNPISAKLVKNVALYLARNMWKLGFISLPQLAKVGPPGEGNHFGGTFPMREQPERLETCKDGKLKGSNRLYVVDSSTFPSIPSTTITLTIMANAYRIANNIE